MEEINEGSQSDPDGAISRIESDFERSETTITPEAQDIRGVPRLLRKAFTGRFATEFVNLLVMAAVLTTLVQASQALGNSILLLIIGVTGGAVLTFVSISGMSISLRGRRVSTIQVAERGWLDAFLFFLNVFAGFLTVVANIAVYVNSSSTIAAGLALGAAIAVALNEFIGLVRAIHEWRIDPARDRSGTRAQRLRRALGTGITRIYVSFKFIAALLLCVSAGLTLEDASANKDTIILLNGLAVGIGLLGYFLIGMFGLVKNWRITGTAQRTRGHTGWRRRIAEINVDSPSLWIGSFSRFAGEIVRVMAFLGIILLMFDAGSDPDNRLIVRAFTVTFGGAFLFAGIWLMIGSLYRFGVQNEPFTGSAWFLTALTRIIAGAAIMTGGIVSMALAAEIQFPLSDDPQTASGWVNYTLRVASAVWAASATAGAVVAFVRVFGNVYQSLVGNGFSIFILLLDFVIVALRAVALWFIFVHLLADPPTVDTFGELTVPVVLFVVAAGLNLLYSLLFDQESVVFRWRERNEQQRQWIQGKGYYSGTRISRSSEQDPQDAQAIARRLVELRQQWHKSNTFIRDQENERDAIARDYLRLSIVLTALVNRRDVPAPATDNDPNREVNELLRMAGNNRRVPSISTVPQPVGVSARSDAQQPELPGDIEMETGEPAAPPNSRRGSVSSETDEEGLQRPQPRTGTQPPPNPRRGSDDGYEADDERLPRRDSMESVPDAPTNEEKDQPGPVSQDTTRTDDQPASRVDE